MPGGFSASGAYSVRQVLVEPTSPNAHTSQEPKAGFEEHSILGAGARIVGSATGPQSQGAGQGRNPA